MCLCAGVFRVTTTLARRCLLSSGSRVRILPGALRGLHVSAGSLFTFGPGPAAGTAAGQEQGRCTPAFPRKRIWQMPDAIAAGVSVVWAGVERGRRRAAGLPGDFEVQILGKEVGQVLQAERPGGGLWQGQLLSQQRQLSDRKSTRLNSSHLVIS